MTSRVWCRSVYGLSVATALALAASLPAQPTGQAMAQTPGQEVASGNRAVLRALDKVSGETTDLVLDRGGHATYGRLEITLVACRYPSDEPAADAFAFLEIHDTRNDEQLFRGWMFASSPALNALDDPRYDVWVLTCSQR